jgi:hypothetical protein
MLVEKNKQSSAKKNKTKQTKTVKSQNPIEAMFSFSPPNRFFYLKNSLKKVFFFEVGRN